MTTFDMNNAVENALNGKLDKYAIYLRKSRADIEAEKEGEGDSLARHKAILLDVAARKGFYVEKIYQEIVSGETIEARPEIQKLINDCYAGKYKGILIVDVTRLSRGNQGDAQIIMDCLKYSNQNRGTLVITPTKTYDVAHNPDDEEYMEFELFMSRREYKMIRKRMDRGKIQSIIEGNYLATHRPYGYNIVTTKTGRTLAPNAEEAKFVKQIFEWAVKENMTAGAIARRLTAMGVATYTGAPEWSRDSVKHILTNPVYIGKIRWNDRMTVKHLIDGQLAKSRPRSSHNEHYIEIEGKHSKHALIDEELFRAAASKFHSDRTKAGLKLRNPLASLLYCEKCGMIMHYKAYDGKRKPRFAHKQSQVCKVKSALVSDVMDALIHALKLYIEDFEVKVNNLPDVDENTVNIQLEELQKELRKTERKLAKLFEAWEDEEITSNEFAERKAVHNARKEAIKEEIEKLEDAVPEQEEYKESIVKLSEALDALQDVTLDAETKNKYLKEIVRRIEFSRENGEEFILDVLL